MLDWYTVAEGGIWYPWPVDHERFILSDEHLDTLRRERSAYSSTVKIHGVYVHSFLTFLGTRWDCRSGWDTEFNKTPKPHRVVAEKKEAA